MHANRQTVLACAVIAAFGAVLPASAQTQGATQNASGKSGVTIAQHENTKSMDRLLEAAQRVREAIQTLATAPAGDQRNRSMQTAREALLDTQQAMIDLPPDLRTRSGPMSEAEYRNAMDKLKQAAQRLRDSAQAMATQSPGDRRNQAIDQVNEAILEVNQAMVQLPWEPGTRTRTGATTGTSASGTSTGNTMGASAAGTPGFDVLDRNKDGMISRSEFSQHMQR